MPPSKEGRGNKVKETEGGIEGEGAREITPKDDRSGSKHKTQPQGETLENPKEH